MSKVRASRVTSHSSSSSRRLLNKKLLCGGGGAVVPLAQWQAAHLSARFAVRCLRPRTVAGCLHSQAGQGGVSE